MAKVLLIELKAIIALFWSGLKCSQGKHIEFLYGAKRCCVLPEWRHVIGGRLVACVSGAKFPNTTTIDNALSSAWEVREVPAGSSNSAFLSAPFKFRDRDAIQLTGVCTHPRVPLAVPTVRTQVRFTVANITTQTAIRNTVVVATEVLQPVLQYRWYNRVAQSISLVCLPASCNLQHPGTLRSVRTASADMDAHVPHRFKQAPFGLVVCHLRHLEACAREVIPRFTKMLVEDGICCLQVQQRTQKLQLHSAT